MNPKTQERLERDAEERRANIQKAQKADAARAADTVNIERQEGDKIRKRTCGRKDLAHFRAQGYKPVEKVGDQKSG